jgi:hypothetical protein
MIGNSTRIMGSLLALGSSLLATQPAEARLCAPGTRCPPVMQPGPSSGGSGRYCMGMDRDSFGRVSGLYERPCAADEPTYNIRYFDYRDRLIWSMFTNPQQGVDRYGSPPWTY